MKLLLFLFLYNLFHVETFYVRKSEISFLDTIFSSLIPLSKRVDRLESIRKIRSYDMEYLKSINDRANNNDAIESSNSQTDNVVTSPTPLADIAFGITGISLIIFMVIALIMFCAYFCKCSTSHSDHNLNDRKKSKAFDFLKNPNDRVDDSNTV